MNAWKPGDVAMVRFGGGDIEPAILTNTGRWYSLVDGCWDSGGMEPVRPLVVIDPESAEDIARLIDYLDATGSPSLRRADLAAALREFAAPTPPAPTEPTGLGAVVEDADGERYIRCQLGNVAPWRAESPPSEDRPWRYFKDLDIPHDGVLSEGIQ